MIMGTLTYTAAEDDCSTVEQILRSRLFMSGTLIGRLKREGGVTLDGEPCRMKDRVHEGQIIHALIDNDIIYGKKPSFPILYEDDGIIIINKPSGMLTHATRVTYEEKTVASELREYIGEGRFHPVNRLDRGTSGVMVIAKNGYYHDLYKKQLHTENFIRTYRAIVCGKPEAGEGIIDAPIGRDDVSPIKRIISRDGKPAQTYYKVISSNDLYSLIEAIPQTGRTHQIRLHMAHIGCPVVGDFLYGTETDEIGRCALHSYSVSLHLPTDGRRVFVKEEMPRDMDEIFNS